MDGIVFETNRAKTRDPAIVAAVLALNNQHVPACNHLELPDLQAILQEAALFAVALDDGKVAGFLICIADGASYGSPNYGYFARLYADTKDYLYVDRIVIDVAYHRRGIGRRLYALVDSLGTVVVPPARHLCCEVNVRPRNDESLAFHQKCGFESVGEQDVEGGAKRVTMLVRPIAAP